LGVASGAARIMSHDERLIAPSISQARLSDPEDDRVTRSTVEASEKNMQNAANLPKGPSLDALGFTVELIQCARVGYGRVAWLAVAPTASEVRAKDGYEALRVTETGSVPVLEVKNDGAAPLLVPGHLVVSGGLQTRTVERSVVVGAHSSALVPVKCVEQGRWSARDRGADATRFRPSEHTNIGMRRSISQLKGERYSQTGTYGAEQSAVWARVDEELTRTSIASPTRSYDAYIDGVKRRLVDDARRAKTEVPARANGAVILPRGGGFWLEAYPTAEALGSHADGLLADLYDPQTAAHGAEEARAEDAIRELLRDVWTCALRGAPRVEGTLGETYVMEPLRKHGVARGARRADGEVVVVGGRVAHVAIGGD
jgi:hypothetical protein